MKVEVRCPAKINLFLSVGPPDQRNYHPLRTVFQAVSLSDQLTVEIEGEQDEISCNWPDLPVDNTLTKTLRLVREMVPLPPVKLSLQKSIPAESGLGGGSSNAAGLLRGIKRLFPDSLEERFMQEVAMSVGADVPFFLVGGQAKATGYGEILDPLPDPERMHFVIVRPDMGVSTPMAFRGLDQTEREWREFPAGDELYNDFERVAPCESIDLGERLQIHGATGALLCGSGSAIFGIYNSEERAAYALEKMKGEGYRSSWQATSLTREESLWTS